MNKPATKQDKARQQARYNALNEPVEIAKGAVEQITGVSPQPEAEQPQPQTQLEQQRVDTEEAEVKRKRRMQALKNELAEIQEKSQYEKNQQKLADEQAKKQQEEKEKEKILVEPPTKPKQGPDWFGRKRKQKGVELVKTPTG